MPKRRVSSAERSARRSTPRRSGAGKDQPLRFIGLSLSGGKSDRSAMAIIDYYPQSHRVFLFGLHDRIRSEEFISADLKLHELIQQFADPCVSVAFDVPLTLPPCIECRLRCPGFETCTVGEVKWMRGLHQQTKKKKPKKMFTPYTQRAVDLYLQTLERDSVDIQQALGANLAPLTARARFIARRLQQEVLEIAVKSSILRLGSQLGVNRSHLLNYRSTTHGEEARRAILSSLVDRTGLFIYQQDLRTLIENYHAFDSLICALVGVLNHLEQTESRPSQYPATAGWALFPVLPWSFRKEAPSNPDQGLVRTSKKLR